MQLLSILAAATTDDVFKSMGQTMQDDVNPGHVLAIIAAGVFLVVLISLFAKREAKKPQTDAVDNPNKLLRELAKEVGLKRKDLRELKKLATLQKVENPLTLLLCPSLMQQAIAKRNANKAA